MLFRDKKKCVFMFLTRQFPQSQYFPRGPTVFVQCCFQSSQHIEVIMVHRDETSAAQRFRFTPTVSGDLG